MNQETDKTTQTPEREKMDGDTRRENTSILRDSDSSKLEHMLDVISLEIVDRLQQFVGCLEKAVEHYRKETEEWHKEREEQLKRQREMFKDNEELWKEIKLWFEQNKNISQSSRTVDECSTCGSPLPTLSSELRVQNFVESTADFTANSDDEEVENLEDDFELDLEDEGGAYDESEEGVEEQEEAEDAETTGLEFSLEYSPETSVMEMPVLSDRSEDGKRKASSLLDDDNSKRKRLTLVECPVCQETLPEMARSGKVLMVARCGHVLCSNCAMRIWSQQRKRCPKCNAAFDIKNLLPVYL